jgi:hypothetical protein
MAGPPETPEEESPYDYTPEWEGRRRHASLHSSMHYLPAHPPPPDQPLSGIQFFSLPAIFQCYGFVSDPDPDPNLIKFLPLFLDPTHVKAGNTEEHIKEDFR